MTSSDLLEQERDQDERAQRVIDDLRAQLDAANATIAELRATERQLRARWLLHCRQELPRQTRASAERLRKRWANGSPPEPIQMIRDSIKDARACAGQSSATYARNELRRFAGIAEAVVLLALWMRGEPAYRAHESVNDLATRLEWERKAKERSR
jgi:Asp-tRNA(Asn)/Glu-tRNA(Gln) amidotransferase A subunit family amidase